ncbi:hypothetical protein [Dactylosporangium sp. CA-092794]|uniref:hypothetical protein n=1 Tax=Dactylosporangium sp. CA-092794 TaxID=3239929 RepID=UPI003D920F63
MTHPTLTRPGHTSDRTAALEAIVLGLAAGHPDTTRQAVAQLGPVLRGVYDQGDTAWQAGAAADFLAATLYASPRFYLRLHAHAVGARDSDLHTHKGTVSSTVLCGDLVNITAAPAFTPASQAGALDVWQCGCLADGSHTQQRTGVRAVIDPQEVSHDRLTAGQGFTVAPGDYHRLTISPDPAAPTVTLCLFEWADPDAPDAFVLTGRPTPVVADRDMTTAAARAAVRQLLDTSY